MLRRFTLLLVTAAALLAGCERQAPAAGFQAIDITGADYGGELSLPDIGGRQRTLADFKGQAVVVFFGFTHCPDVCPTTMAELAAVKEKLGEDGERLQALFVTVDPERDTPKLLERYMANFDPSFIALRGTVEQTQALAKSFKAYFQKVPGKEPGSYSVDHTAGAYVFDPQGRLRLFVRYGQPVEAWVSDLKRLLA
ncbi:MAG: SCO family protein [Methylibium sp.]|uniref:SCO family protein n=1 Tax=Methylibium sp. TaxID=2067992 RepID=UPI0018404065|nr:SCO family protein [Methylibium sp.]MBA3596794.1 SCO family protein [Methylibium sp.]